jgi:hypothetical protein
MKSKTTGLPKVTGSVMTSNAQTRTLTPVETHANSRQTHDEGPLPLPPGASDLRGHEPARGRIRRLADRMGQREQGQDQLIFKENVKIPEQIKEHIPRLPNFY